MQTSKTSPLNATSTKNVKPNNKHLTIDDLANLINTLSSNQAKGFESINKRIDDIKALLSKLDSDLGECQKKLTVLKTEFSL